MTRKEEIHAAVKVIQRALADRIIVKRFATHKLEPFDTLYIRSTGAGELHRVYPEPYSDDKTENYHNTDYFDVVEPAELVIQDLKRAQREYDEVFSVTASQNKRLQTAKSEIERVEDQLLKMGVDPRSIK